MNSFATYKYIYIYTHTTSWFLSSCYIFYSLMAVQLFVGPCPLFQFLDSKHWLRDSLDLRSAVAKASTYTQDNTNTK
jgi:hypothetical protein